MKYNKKTLWRLIVKNANKKVHSLHIISILNILIEEIVKELKLGNNIEIKNFGTLKVNKIKPKKILAVNTREITFIKSIKLLRFTLSKEIAKYLSNKSIEDMKSKCSENQE
jgi:nucleoid DNA-binding protein